MTERNTEIGLLEIVEIRESARTSDLEVDGTEGVVVGLGEARGGAAEGSYAVLIEQLDRTVMVWVSELRATGRRVERSDIYDGTSLRVTSQGEVVDDMSDPRANP